MATESEILGPLSASVSQSGGGSGGTLRRGLDNLANAIQTRVDEGDLAEFHAALEEGISDTVEEGFRGLQEPSQAPLQSFQDRMRRLRRAMDQGSSAVAQRARLEATRLTREAMHANPRLRREIAREASLVIGNSVELAEAAALDQLASARSAAAQEQYKRIVEYAYADWNEGGLGLSPVSYPDVTSASFADAVVRKEADRAAYDANLEQLARMEADATVTNEEQFRYLKKNRHLFHRAITDQVSQITNKWQRLEQQGPQAMEAYRNSTEFAQDQLALAQLRSNITELAQTGVNLRIDGAQASLEAIIRGPLEVIDAAEKMLDDPMWGNAIESYNEIAKHRFIQNNNLQEMKFMMDEFEPIIKLLGESVFPSAQVITEDIVEGMKPTFQRVMSNMFGADYERHSDNVPTSSARQNYEKNVLSAATRLYEDDGFPGTVEPEERLRRGVQNVEAQRKMVANIDRATGLTPEQSTTFLNNLATHYAMFDSLNGEDFEEVQENTIGLLADPNILKLGESTGTTLPGQTFAESANPFLEEEAEAISNTIAQLPDQLVEVADNWNPVDVPFTSVVTLESDPETGTVRFKLANREGLRFRSNLPVGEGSRVDAFFGRRRYEGLLEDINRKATAMVRAEAHRKAMELGVYNPERVREFYQAAYNEMMGDIERAFSG